LQSPLEGFSSGARLDACVNLLSLTVHQCVIYDSDAADARLIGIEYIVSERARRAFRQLCFTNCCSGLQVAPRRREEILALTQV
jgi:hypothetical protein